MNWCRNEESLMMRVLKKVGLNGFSWSMRRLHCPVSESALVLEVGSGGNPYFRSNVLLDAYEETRERHWAPLVSDRPTVLGFVEHLPFRDKVFDFVIASHVLEHSQNPEKFLSELQRVAKAGYIEVPDAFMERINPYRDHRLEITVRDGRLLIRKKKDWLVDSELVALYEDRVKRILTSRTMRENPYEFHVRYYWSDSIDFDVLNPLEDAGWAAPESEVGMSSCASGGMRQKFGQWVLKRIRSSCSQNKRNAELSLDGLLACPVCGSIEIARGEDSLKCEQCSSIYPIKNGVPVMYPVAGAHDSLVAK